MKKEFIKPWMKDCNQDLILRFWRSKGSPGKLTIKKYGIRLVFINTMFGELCIKPSNIFNYVKKLNGGDLNV